MKKIKYMFLVFAVIFLSGCSTSMEQSYVKNVLLDKNRQGYVMKVVCYDFTSEEESYTEKEYTSDDIYQLGIKAMKDGNYSFRLCENCYITANMFNGDIDKAVYVINSLKLPPGTDIICYTGTQINNEAARIEKLISTPLYNLSVTGNNVTGAFQITDDTGENYGSVLVHNGNPVKVLTDKQWQILNILTGTAEKINYVFRDSQMFATLENMGTYFSFNDEALNIELNISLKEYKGIQDSMQSKELFTDFLKSDIENTVFELYNDTSVETVYNLHWYCQHKGKECQDINVKVNII